MGLDGVEIFCNPSGSHHELRKSYVAVDLIQNATMKVLYSTYLHIYRICKASMCYSCHMFRMEGSTSFPTNEVVMGIGFTTTDVPVSH